MSGYEYGNTRLRARWSQRLRPADYSAMLVAPDLDHMVGRLAGADMRPDVEASLPRVSGLRLIDEIVRRHLTRQFRDLRSFYTEETADEVRPLLDRWDVRNLVVVLRGQVARLAAPLVDTLLVPVGSLRASLLDRLAAQPGLRAAIDLMVAWSVPTRRTARELAARLPVFEQSGDPAVLEEVLHRHLFTESGAPEVRDSIARETDESNILAALRLRRARLAGETLAGFPWLEGGRFPEARLEDIIHANDPEVAAALITGGPHLPAWEGAVEQWVAGQDLAALEAALRAIRWRHEISQFRLGDPLGAAVPVGFAAAKQGEAHDVRLLARTIVHQLPVEPVQSRLVMT